MKDFMEDASLLKETCTKTTNKPTSKTNWPILCQDKNTHIYAGTIAVYISTYSLKDMKPLLTERFQLQYTHLWSGNNYLLMNVN